jgi:hypothetical protein
MTLLKIFKAPCPRDEYIFLIGGGHDDRWENFTDR